MRKYKNNHHNSKVAGYDIFPSSVKIYYKDGSEHIYDSATLGEERLAMLKVIILAGANLDALLNGQYTLIV